MDRYLDTSLTPADRAKDLLAKMSLHEKMAQIRGIFPFGVPGDGTDDWVPGRGIGQISALRVQMTETTREEAVDWLRGMQELVLRESPHAIPAAIHMEGVNGAYFQGTANYPTGVSRGASFDPALEEEIAENVARIELSAGITQILAPVLDVARDPRMGRCGESYGEDPTLAAALGSAYTKGIQKVTAGGRRAAATAKHFFGFHSSRGGIHGGGSSIGERELREIYGKSFQAAITEADLKGVMPCYNVMDGIPFSASRRYLTEILREKMGFTGVTVSDYSAVSQVFDVKKVGECYADAGEKCLKAGMDVELPSPLAYDDELERRFASVRHGERRAVPAYAPERGAVATFAEKDIEQVHMVLEFPGAPIWTKDSFTLSVLSNILGGNMSSRLFQHIREERGLCYSVYSFPMSYRGIGSLCLYVGSTEKQAKEALRLMLAELDDLLAHGVTEEEFRRCKQQLKGSYVLSMESPAAHMNAIGKTALLIGERYDLNETLARIESVTIDDVNALIPKVLTRDSFTLAAVGRLAKVQEPMRKQTEAWSGRTIPSR